MARSVLIVDDERLLVRTLSCVLREAGYRITVAGSAEQAEKQALGASPFDLIMLDHRLPKESGIDLMKRLRERTVRSRVILMTAYETPDVKAEARRLKVDRYLRKPFDLRVMMDEVRNLIGPGARSAAG